MGLIHYILDQVLEIGIFMAIIIIAIIFYEKMINKKK